MKNKALKATILLLDSLPKRYQKVLIKRFGLFGHKKHTLEEIGKKENITRERVRQIQNTALSKLKNQLDKVKDALEELEGYLESQGGLKREDKLLDNLIPEKESQGLLILLLHLHQKTKRRKEDDKFYTLWLTDEKAISKALKLIKHLESYLRKKKELVDEEELYKIGTLAFDLDKNHFLSYVEASKKIEQGPHSYYGISEWPEIVLKGVRDKAYLVLKLRKEPMHFREITKAINEIFKGDKKALPQTVHNELIRDERFVLVGRGIYALKELGYKPGTVKEIIADILKKYKRGLTKEEIITKVLAQRKVKENTISLALLDKNLFVKDKKGRYTLIR